MITVADQTKKNSTIFLDGIQFIRVHFEDCELIYEASDKVEFEDCTFERVGWTFTEAAERMISFLAMLSAEGGSSGKGIVNAVMSSITTGKVTKARTVPASVAITVHVPTATASAEAPPPAIVTR